MENAYTPLFIVYFWKISGNFQSLVHQKANNVSARFHRLLSGFIANFPGLVEI